MNFTQGNVRRILFCGPIRSAFAVILLLEASYLHAHNFQCVKTSAEFQSALDDSAGMYSGEDNYIQLAAGTYKTGTATGNGPFHFTSTSTHLLGIRGGATANCQSFLEDATLVKLDGNNATQVLSINSPNGYVFIVELTIQNGHSTTSGGGLVVNPGSSGNEVQVTNNIFHDNHSDVVGGAVALYTNYTYFTLPELYFDGNLVYNNSAFDYGAGIISEDNESSYIVNNTIYNNTASKAGGTGGLAVSGSVGGQIFNNIFWSNTNYGLNLLSGNMVVSYNDYGTITGMPADPTSTGNLSTNPLFVDVSTNNFHLSGTSPLLGKGVGSHSASIDLDGHDYVLTNRIDMGAYEETIFVDGLDGN